MNNKGTHTGAFKRNENGKIIFAEYAFSPWDKKIGDKMVTENVKCIIEVVGVNRNDAIRQMNTLIKKSRSL